MLEFTSPASLKSADQTLTAAWANVGSRVNNVGFKKVVFPIDYKINDSSNLRFRVLWSAASTGSTFDYQQVTASATNDTGQDHYFELGVDADNYALIPFDINPIGFLQLQTQVSAAGTTAASLIDVKYLFVAE